MNIWLKKTKVNPNKKVKIQIEGDKITSVHILLESLLLNGSAIRIINNSNCNDL